MYSLYQSYICISLGSWIFILHFGIHNLMLMLYFVAPFLAFAIHWYLTVGSCALCHIPVSECFCFVFEYFLTLCHYKMIQAHLCISYPVLESAFSPKGPVSFYWRMVLETKAWVLRWGHCY